MLFLAVLAGVWSLLELRLREKAYASDKGCEIMYGEVSEKAYVRVGRRRERSPGAERKEVRIVVGGWEG